MSIAPPPRSEVLYAEAHAERFRDLAVDNGIVLERDDADIDGFVEWFAEPASLISGFEASDDLRERTVNESLGYVTRAMGVRVRGSLPLPT